MKLRAQLDVKLAKFFVCSKEKRGDLLILSGDLQDENVMLLRLVALLNIYHLDGSYPSIGLLST